MQKILNLMDADIKQLNDVIRNDLTSQVVLINQISEYIISAGGKRIRPLLTLLCGRLCNYSDKDNGVLLHKMAAMIEYIHTATLLHDDVVDESGLRRGRKTSNAVFGNAASILVGDFIYTRAFQMMVESELLPLLKVMANATNMISEGEVLQLLNIGRNDLTEIEYFKVIESKTAKLFEASARVAAIVNHVSHETEEHLARYGIYLGTAFQIADDVLDYRGSADEMGKNVGDDLLEGKVTLPLIYLLQHGNGVEQSLIREAVNNPKNVDLLKVISLIRDSDALDYCCNMAGGYAKKAKEELGLFAIDNPYCQAMMELADYSVSRIV